MTSILACCENASRASAADWAGRRNSIGSAKAKAGNRQQRNRRNWRTETGRTGREKTAKKGHRRFVFKDGTGDEITYGVLRSSTCTVPLKSRVARTGRADSRAERKPSRSSRL